ncbi:GGDEF domain-containing protein [Butyrivibrio sp. VCB2006]|uniref:GGDEF domain-containing protein n=1 Tax=Butyrivibrio sp. VCB2006 TaxID=1280679 RepID=UPI00041D6A9B|nr:GGDEF domain-containing protein [Butyrivibrio sp. VCB2006]
MADYINYVLANFACIVFLSIVVFNLERGVDKQFSTVILSRIMKMLVLYFVTDSAWILFECGVFHSNKIGMYIATIIPYICLLMTSWLWYSYCEIVQGSTKILTRKGIFTSAIPFFVALLILIIGVFTDYLFKIDGTGYLEYGPLYVVLLSVPFGYLMYSSIRAFYRAFTSNRYYDHGLFVAMGLFPVTPLTCGVLQAFFLTVPIMCYGATAAMLLLYITAIENHISTDPLTQINNRQEMQRYLTQKMKSKNQDMDLYLMILDVDHFKSINDKYGHVEGDKALVTVAEAMKASCSDSRNRAFLSRFGGDEFIVIMEAEGRHQVQETADLIRANVVRLNEESGAPFKLEASIGYAKYDFDNPTTIPQFIAKADEKLYEMKENR